MKTNCYLILAIMLFFITRAIAQPPFTATQSAIPESWQKQMLGRSWKPDCPVPLSQLTYLKLAYWGFDNKPHIGTLIINKRFASEVIQIFRTLYQQHFPIQEMKAYAAYPVGQYAEHNDTVGFYCRPSQDDVTHFSTHSYGLAIDINPLINPYYDYKAKKAWPVQGARYMDRKLGVHGMIQPGDTAFMAFTHHGWLWGGFWTDGADYMHFEK